MLRKLGKLATTVRALCLKAVNRVLRNGLYMAYHGDDFYFVLTDMENWLATKVKYSNESDEVLNAYEQARDELYRIMDRWGVDLWHVE